MSASRRLAPSKRSSARPSASRAALAASSAARASRSAAASAFSASCRRSAQARRAASAVSTSPISARRFSAKTCGAFSSSVRSRLASRDALIERGDLARMRRSAVRSSRPCRRRATKPAVGESRLRARSPAARPAPRRAWRACRRCRRARRRAWLPDRRRGRAWPRARSASALPAAASSRLAMRRLRASASAESRAAWRLRSRSRVRVSVSDVLAASKADCAASTAARRASSSARATASSPSISAKRLRCASRRAAPVGAWAAATKPSQRHRSPSRDTSRWPVLSDGAEPRAGFAVDHADLRQPARQLRRRLDVSRERLGAFRQRGIARIGGANRAPVHRRGGIDRRVEIVAERGAERLFVAFLDRDVIDHRRPQIACLQRQHLGQRLGLGFQPLHALFRLAQRGLRGFQVGARVVACGFCGDGRGLGFGERRLGAFDRGGERRACRRFRASPVRARWRRFRRRGARCARHARARRSRTGGAAR